MSNYTVTINWLSWNFPRSVQKVTFRHGPTQPLSEYHDVLNCEVEFDAQENSLILDLETHSAPLPTSNARIKHSLYNLIDQQRPSLALVAKDLSLTERTLKRQLKSEGTRFQNILRAVKMELCEGYMKENLPLSEINGAQC